MNPSPAELTETQIAELQNSKLFNPDLAPVPASRRKWRAGSFAALWISMSACIPTYMLASSLVDTKSCGMKLVAGYSHHFPGQSHCPHSHGPQCARRHALWHPFSDLLPRLFRHGRRE